MQETLRDWQNFYFMIGGASAGLIGLMFVAISLGSHLVNTQTAEDMRIYVNPSLFHFVTVLVTACVMLVPVHTIASLSIILGLVCLAGLRQSMDVLKRMRRRNADAIDEDNHFLWHAVLPTLGYVAGCVSTGGIAITTLFPWLIGFALMVTILIVCAIRNVWVLVLWIAKQGRT
jgi:hypothetical protein